MGEFIMFKNTDLSRRDFVKTASAISISSLLSSSASLFAAGTQTIKIGLVGCGNRGTGALGDCLEAAKYLNLTPQVVAIADYFMTRAVEVAQKYQIPQERCFSGVDAYKKVIASDADIVLLVTPPVFRALHFEAAIKANKHVFMEKPLAVDAPCVRRIMKTGTDADAQKRSVVVGAQRHHQAAYRQTAFAVSNGAIGKLLCGQIWWCGGALWYNARKEGESDADYLVRNWVSFTEMSGDHIVEQHFHNIDAANWFIGRPPVSAHGVGGRARRKTGNQFDFFSVDFDYGQDVHVQGMARQINGCYSRVAEFFVGTEGVTWGDGPGSVGYKKPIQLPVFEEHKSPYVQEHVDLLRSVIEAKPINETQRAAESNIAALMARISAYTGQIVRWKELMEESAGSPWYGMSLSPKAEDFENNTVKAPADDVVAIPGRD